MKTIHSNNGNNSNNTVITMHKYNITIKLRVDISKTCVMRLLEDLLCLGWSFNK